MTARFGRVLLSSIALQLLWSAQPEIQWALSVPLPEARTDYAAGILDGKLVIAGGDWWLGSKGRWTRKVYSLSVHAFDPSRQTWEKLPDMPTPLAAAASVVVDNTLWVLGGYTGAEVNRRIYTLKKTRDGFMWRVAGTLPMNRLFSGAAAIGTTIYLAGGSTRFEPLDDTGTCCATNTATDTMFAFDTANPKRGWQPLPAIPGPRRWFFSTATDGRDIWLFGGRSQAGPQGPVKVFSDILRYRVSAAKWLEPQPLPEAGHDTPPTPVYTGRTFLLISDVRKIWLLDPQRASFTAAAPAFGMDLHRTLSRSSRSRVKPSCLQGPSKTGWQSPPDGSAHIKTYISARTGYCVPWCWPPPP
jgi:hypothetical protein